MNRFTFGVAAYIAACLVAVVVIVVRGDGPHPLITALYPPNGDRYFAGGAAQVTFSQPMDQASVERALQVSPGTQGQGTWYGTTLNLQPVGDWKPNLTYYVQLSGTVKDTGGRPLRTPFSFWFRVHHIGRLTLCGSHGVQTVCERVGSSDRPLFPSPWPVRQFALSQDGSQLAFSRVDTSGLPHLFVANVDGTQIVQLTFGRTYADSGPYWSAGDASSVNYLRQRVAWRSGHPTLHKARLWNIGIDRSNNAPL